MGFVKRKMKKFTKKLFQFKFSSKTGPSKIFDIFAKLFDVEKIKNSIS
jgi:hypothetical protein